MSRQSNNSLNEANLKHLTNYIGHKHQLLTFGFCRENTTILEKIIPDPIINICLIYAFLMTEYFKDNVRNIQISDDKRTATNFKALNNAIFGSFIINCDENTTDIYTWTIYINSIGLNIIIGVDEVDDDLLYPLYTWNAEYHQYAYSSQSQIIHDKYSSCRKNIIFAGAEFKYSTDDIITMIVDCGRKTVDFYKNDKHVYQCKNVHPNKYRLGILLCANVYYPEYDDEDFLDIPASVTLQDFSISASN